MLHFVCHDSAEIHLFFKTASYHQYQHDWSRACFYLGEKMRLLYGHYVHQEVTWGSLAAAVTPLK